MPKVTKKSPAGPVNKKQRGSVSSLSVIEMAEQGMYEFILKKFANDRIQISDFTNRAKDTADTALHIAASRGHVETVCVLLGILLNSQIKGDNLRTPLHCSAANGHLLVTQRLVEIGDTNVDVKDADGATALHLAEKNGHDHVVLFLAKHGATITEQTIFLAISKGNEDLVELCLQKGVSVDTLNNNKESLVVLAAREKRWEIMSLLLRNGANATLCKGTKESAIVFAAQDGNTKAVAELLKHGVKSDSGQVKQALMLAKNREVVHAIFSSNPEIIEGVSGVNAFLDAATNGNVDVLKALKQLGVNVNCTNGQNETALYLASDKGHHLCVKELIALHADLNIKNDHGNTAVHAAARSSHVRCVSILKEAGAKLEEKNKSRKTAYEVALTDEIRNILPCPPEKKTRQFVSVVNSFKIDD